MRFREAPNTDAIPSRDDLPHSEGHRCRCRPLWKAYWDTNVRGVVWIFRHRDADGVPVEVQVNYE